MTALKPLIRRRSEAGYTLLLAVFLVAVMIITATAVAPNLLTDGRRQREEDLIWRGNQYARAVGLYYRRFGRYPTKLDDLTKQTNGVRFLRQAYKDPMNKEDGSWRFIYIGPNGALIGSLRYTSLQQYALASGNPIATSPFGGMAPPLPPGAATNPQATSATAGGPAGQANSSTDPNSLSQQPQQLMSDVIGGNIIGVASKIKKSSLKVYKGADTYEQWEFIYSPIGQVGGPQMYPNPGQGGNGPNQQLTPTSQQPPTPQPQ
jgi:type II secretory pathway pseudopilin PulG